MSSNVVKLTSTKADVVVSNPEIMLLLNALAAMCGRVALRSFTFKKKGATKVYDCSIIAADGRKWEQTLAFASETDTNPSMTMAVKDQWFKDEVDNLDTVLTQLVSARNSLELTDLDVAWGAALT